jgi:hypothetical protein
MPDTSAEPVGQAFFCKSVRVNWCGSLYAVARGAKKAPLPASLGLTAASAAAGGGPPKAVEAVLTPAAVKSDQYSANIVDLLLMEEINWPIWLLRN